MPRRPARESSLRRGPSSRESTSAPQQRCELAVEMGRRKENAMGGSNTTARSLTPNPPRGQLNYCGSSLGPSTVCRADVRLRLRRVDRGSRTAADRRAAQLHSPATHSPAMGLVLVPAFFGLPQIQKDRRWPDSGVCIGGLTESGGDPVFHSVAGTGHQLINSRKPGRRIHPETIFREYRGVRHPRERAETSLFSALRYFRPMNCSDPATRLRSPISVHARFLVCRTTTSRIRTLSLALRPLRINATARSCFRPRGPGRRPPPR